MQFIDRKKVNALLEEKMTFYAVGSKNNWPVFENDILV